MTYKDPDKQREANAEQMRRARAKGNTKPTSNQSNTESQRVTDQDFTRLMAGAGQGHVKVSKPGDDDYVPMCETTMAFIDGRDKRPETGKRGKDIKTFADLPPDVQQTIDSMSRDEAGKVEQKDKAKRTAAAIKYQHLFPHRYNSTGPITEADLAAVTGKPGDADTTQLE